MARRTSTSKRSLPAAPGARARVFAAGALAAAFAACAAPQKVSLADLSSTLQISSLPTGAAVEESGRPLGRTPLDVPLVGGRIYDFGLSAAGFTARRLRGTRDDLMHLGDGQLGVVLVPAGMTASRPPSFDDPAALSSIAAELGRRKDWGQAAELWARIVLIRPRDARAHRGMGSALAKLGQDEQAIREYEQYLFLAPDAPDAARVRKAVDAYRGGIELPSADADAP